MRNRSRRPRPRTPHTRPRQQAPRLVSRLAPGGGRRRQVKVRTNEHESVNAANWRAEAPSVSGILTSSVRVFVQFRFRRRLLTPAVAPLALAALAAAAQQTAAC